MTKLNVKIDTLEPGLSGAQGALRNGVVDKSGQGVRFPYDRTHIEFKIEAVA